MRTLAIFVLRATTVSAALSLSACQSAPPEPSPAPAQKEPAAKATASATASATPLGAAAGSKATQPPARPAPPARHVTAQPVASVTPSPDDPLKGRFDLAEATKGISGTGSLEAVIDTDLGSLTCKLYDDKAPLTVANFIGLARGTRPWKDPDGKWVKKPAYDGTIFHRIIKGFMIQGGDAKGNGSGEPGYVIADEIWENAVHDRAGLLCMANRGKNTNGAQFFITDAAAPHLDNGYTIFGECAPEDMVHKLASVEVQGEHPKSPPKIKSVKIRRAPK